MPEVNLVHFDVGSVKGSPGVVAGAYDSKHSPNTEYEVIEIEEGNTRFKNLVRSKDPRTSTHTQRSINTLVGSAEKHIKNTSYPTKIRIHVLPVSSTSYGNKKDVLKYIKDNNVVGLSYSLSRGYTDDSLLSAIAKEADIAVFAAAGNKGITEEWRRGKGSNKNLFFVGSAGTKHSNKVISNISEFRSGFTYAPEGPTPQQIAKRGDAAHYGGTSFAAPNLLGNLLGACVEGIRQKRLKTSNEMLKSCIKVVGDQYQKKFNDTNFSRKKGLTYESFYNTLNKIVKSVDYNTLKPDVNNMNYNITRGGFK